MNPQQPAPTSLAHTARGLVLARIGGILAAAGRGDLDACQVTDPDSIGESEQLDDSVGESEVREAGA